MYRVRQMTTCIRNLTNFYSSLFWVCFFLVEDHAAKGHLILEVFLRDCFDSIGTQIFPTKYYTGGDFTCSLVAVEVEGQWLRWYCGPLLVYLYLAVDILHLSAYVTCDTGCPVRG